MFLAGSGSGPGCCCSCCFSSTLAGSDSACSCASSDTFTYSTDTCDSPTTLSVAHGLPTTVADTTPPRIDTSTLADVSTEPLTSGGQPLTSGQPAPATTTSTTSTTTTTTTTTTTRTTITTTTPTSTEVVTTEPPIALIDERWLMEQLAKMPLEERVSLGFNLSELVLDCRFAGSQCTNRSVINFTWLFYYNTVRMPTRPLQHS